MCDHFHNEDSWRAELFVAANSAIYYKSYPSMSIFRIFSRGGAKWQCFFCPNQRAYILRYRSRQGAHRPVDLSNSQYRLASTSHGKYFEIDYTRTSFHWSTLQVCGMRISTLAPICGRIRTIPMGTHAQGQRSECCGKSRGTNFRTRKTTSMYTLGIWWPILWFELRDRCSKTARRKRKGYDCRIDDTTGRARPRKYRVTIRTSRRISKGMEGKITRQLCYSWLDGTFLHGNTACHGSANARTADGGGLRRSLKMNFDGNKR